MDSFGLLLQTQSPKGGRTIRCSRPGPRLRLFEFWSPPARPRRLSGVFGDGGHGMAQPQVSKRCRGCGLVKPAIDFPC